MSDAGNEQVRKQTGDVACIECGRPSDARWAAWRAYRVDDPELDEPPTLAFYCPACAEAEFGPNR